MGWTNLAADEWRGHPLNRFRGWLILIYMRGRKTHPADCVDDAWQAATRRGLGMV